MAKSKTQLAAEQAFREQVERAERRRDVRTCEAFMNRAVTNWRRQDSPYAPTAQGMGQALLDELKRMKEEVGHG